MHYLLLSTLSIFVLSRVGEGGSYLSEGSQVVSFESNVSNTCCNSSGVPQGSVLEHVLSLLFINDIS